MTVAKDEKSSTTLVRLSQFKNVCPRVCYATSVLSLLKPMVTSPERPVQPQNILCITPVFVPMYIAVISGIEVSDVQLSNILL